MALLLLDPHVDATLFHFHVQSACHSDQRFGFWTFILPTAVLHLAPLPIKFVTVTFVQ